MTARGLWIMVGMMRRRDRLKMLRVEPGTHPLLSLGQLPEDGRVYRIDNATSTGYSEKLSVDILLNGETFTCGPNKHWKTHPEGMGRLGTADRLVPAGRSLG